MFKKQKRGVLTAEIFSHENPKIRAIEYAKFLINNQNIEVISVNFHEGLIVLTYKWVSE